jgi:ABC-type transport system substrate-binding protein
LPSVGTLDPPAAGQLLSAAGYRGLHQRTGRRLTFTCLVAGIETQPFERTALLLQRQLYDAGVDMQLALLPPNEFVRRVAHGDFDAALFESAAFTTSWVYSFWHSPPPGGSGFIGHGYSGADAELDAMQNARNEDELRRGVAAVYKKMSEDPPAIFIAWPEVSRAVSTRFDVPVEEGRDIMGGNLWLWRPARQR